MAFLFALEAVHPGTFRRLDDKSLRSCFTAIAGWLWKLVWFKVEEQVWLLSIQVHHSAVDAQRGRHAVKTNRNNWENVLIELLVTSYYHWFLLLEIFLPNREFVPLKVNRFFFPLFIITLFTWHYNFFIIILWLSSQLQLYTHTIRILFAKYQ